MQITFNPPEKIDLPITITETRRHSTSPDKQVRLFMANEGEEMTGLIALDPIYNLEIVICQGNKLISEQYVKEVFPQCEDFKIPDCFGYSYTKERVAVIWIGYTRADFCNFSILAHEAAHIAFAIGHSRGFRLKEASQEFYCYYIQFIMNLVAQSMGYLPEGIEACD